MREELVQAGIDALAIMIPLLAALGGEYIRRRIGTEKMHRLKEELQAKQELATLAVRFAQQAYKDLGGQERGEKAMAWMAAQAEAKGIPVTEDELQGLIEAALRAVKDEFGEAWAKAS